MPGVIGCIDGTHVAIVRPNQNEEVYFNRKHYHSLNVLLVSITYKKIACFYLYPPTYIYIYFCFSDL